VPAIEARADKVAFVREGEPIPVQGVTATGALLEPRKLAVIVALTAEMIAGSNAEVLVTDALTRSVGLAIDAALFDAAAGDTSRPPGLRNGIAAVSASGLTGTEAMIADLAALATAIAPVAGNGPLIFVASPARVVRLRLRAPREISFEILASSALADDMLIAVASNALASAVDPTPRFEASIQATLHMEDSTPLALSSTGSPNTVAAPVRSLWQSDAIGLRLILQVSWGLRAATGIAWLENAVW
jgi:hypothetical protein